MLPKQVVVQDNEVLVIKDCILDYCAIFCSMQKEVLNLICESVPFTGLLCHIF
jgi:hypothetical protein